MKQSHMNASPAIRLQLHHGMVVIARWSYQLAKAPTLGESVAIASLGGHAPAGFRDTAFVFRIEHDLATRDLTVMLDLVPEPVV